MFKKIPFLLWIFQLISVPVVILNAIGFFMYAVELISLFSFTNFLGTLLNLVSMVMIVIIIIGIWKKTETARIGIIIYTVIYFLGLLYGSHRAYLNMEIHQPEEMTTFLISTALQLIVFCVFLVSIIQSKKVKKYFFQDQKLV